MKREKIGRKIGALALTGIIASATILPCTVNASELVKEDNIKVIGSESSEHKVKKKGRKMKVDVQSSGDTIVKAEKKAKYENLTDEEKEVLKAERKMKKQSKSRKSDKNVTSE